MNRILALIATVAVAAGAGAQTFNDDFNRANSGDLGSNWTLVSNSTQVMNNQAENGSSSLGLSTVNGFSAAYNNVLLSADITTGQSLSYVALVLGYADQNANDSVFVKVQANSGGQFTNYAFYTGNNINSGLAGFLTLSTPFTSAHMVVWMSDADTVNLGLDTTGSGTFDQVYSSTGVSALNLGTGVGLGLYGDATADNFHAAAVPEPISCTLLGIGGLALMRRRRA